MISPDICLAPNLITLGRILLIPFFLYLLLSGQPFWAAVLFLVLALSDAFDGYLARKLGQGSDLGKLLDPIADKIVSVLRQKEAAHGNIVAARMAGKIKTVVQDLAILMLILDLPYGIPVLWLAVILSLISGVDYIVRK